MSAILTPDECFELDGTRPSTVELIRYRLANPAPGGHKHHLLACSLVRYWSKALGRKITVEQIPVVTVTGPEHYRIHFDSALDYQARGSKGRFAAHGLAANFLAQFADMTETEWEEHRKINSAALLAMYADPEIKAKHKASAERRAKDPLWKERNHAAAKRRAQDPEWRAKMSSVVQALYADPGFRATNRAVLQARAQDPTWQEKNKAAREALYEEPGFWQAHRDAVKKFWAENTEHKEKHRAMRQASFPDVIATFPDGSEETFPGQSEAARALGITQSSIGRYLRGEAKSFRGAFRGYSFRYAA